jgi:hypothetical protein
MSSKLEPTDLESEAKKATLPELRVGLIVRLLATGEWVHGVSAYTLAALWGLQSGEVLAMLDEAMGQFASVPGSADGLRGLGFARLCHLADMAMAHTELVVKADKEGGFFSQQVPAPQYRDAINATKAAYELALAGDPEGVAVEAEIDRLMAGLRESKAETRGKGLPK